MSSLTQFTYNLPDRLRHLPRRLRRKPRDQAQFLARLFDISGVPMDLSGVVMEIGCGPNGGFGDLVRAVGGEYHGIDIVEGGTFQGVLEDHPLRKVDLCISNSALEHIEDFEPFAGALPSGMHIHLVDFGNHRSKERPFAKIYELCAEDYVRKYGRHINLLRHTDMKRMTGLKFRPTVVCDLPDRIDPSWTHPREVLAVRVGLLYGRR